MGNARFRYYDSELYSASFQILYYTESSRRGLFLYRDAHLVDSSGWIRARERRFLRYGSANDRGKQFSKAPSGDMVRTLLYN